MYVASVAPGYSLGNRGLGIPSCMRGKQSGEEAMEELSRAFDTKPSTTALESEPVSGEHEPGAHPGKLWIAMHGKGGKTIGGQEAGVIFYAMESNIRGSGMSAQNKYKTETPSGRRSADQAHTPGTALIRPDHTDRRTAWPPAPHQDWISSR